MERYGQTKTTGNHSQPLMVRPHINITDFILHGQFGPFHRRTEVAAITSLLGPADDWWEYPGIYGYGNICFELVNIDPDHRLNVQFLFQHPEHFQIQHKSWWSNMLYNWPDSRFDVEFGEFKSGARLDSLYDQYFANAEELQHPPNSSWRMFLMPSGVSVQFCNVDMDGQYTLYSLMSLHRWGPDCLQTEQTQRLPVERRGNRL